MTPIDETLDRYKVFSAKSASDTMHLVAGQSSFCGRDASEWFELESPASKAIKSAYCCKRCVKVCHERGLIRTLQGDEDNG